jgi:hypothetical protein
MPHRAGGAASGGATVRPCGDLPWQKSACAPQYPAIRCGIAVPQRRPAVQIVRSLAGSVQEGQALG